MMKRTPHPLIDTLIHLEGNPRICVYTEPLWAIPFNLYLPYISVYMLALGLHDAQIGLISTVSLFFQIFMSLLSGPVTDKLGRRLTTFIFDIISWSLPALIWALAQNFTWFFAAALLNSVFRITANSWSLLLVEDAPRKQLVSIWSWVTIGGIISGFFAPLAGILVARYSLVTAVRVLYINAFIFMTIKFVILYIYGTETRQGVIKMRECAGVPLLQLIGGSRGALRRILHNSYTLYTFLIAVVLLIYETIKGIFWSIMVVKELALPESSIALFPLLRSVLILAFYFFLIPRMNHLRFKRPFLCGFVLLLLSNIILALSPAHSYLFVIVSTLLDAAAVAIITPFKETLVVDSVDPHERAGIMGIFNVSMLLIASPFGWLAGIMSERSRYLPFYFLMVLAVAGIILVYLVAARKKEFSE